MEENRDEEKKMKQNLTKYIIKSNRTKQNKGECDGMQQNTI